METPISSKVYAAGIGAAASQILIWLIESLGHTNIPNTIEGAISVIIVAGLAWLTGDKLRDAGQAAVEASNDTPVGEIAEVQEATPDI